MGCLLILVAGLGPRAGMIGIWLLSDWVDRSFSGALLPILGVIFLPWTTVLYVIGFVAGDAAAPWGVLGIIIGLFLDIAVHAGSVVGGRRRMRG